MQTLATLEDVCEELNLERWECLRAISRGVLSAETVGEGVYRVTGKAIEEATRSRDLNGPQVFSNWVDDRSTRHRGQIFLKSIRSMLEARIPDRDPEKDLVSVYTAEMRDVGGRKPARLLIPDESGSHKLPYISLSECYTAWWLIERTKRLEKDQPHGQLSIGDRLTSPLERLYESPRAYAEFTDKAWQQFQKGRISVGRIYPNPNSPHRPIRRVFTLPHSKITGLDRDRLLRLAF